MDPRIRFLIALENSIRTGAIKRFKQALDFARREFGEIDDNFFYKILDVFKKQGKTKKGGIVDIKTRKEYKKELDETLGPADDVFGSPIKDQKMKEFDKAAAKDVTPKGEINPITDQMSTQQREFLGFPNKSVEAIVRTAARDVLEKAGLGPRIKGQDPIDMARQIYGDEILDALDNISGELLDASSYPEISRILTEKKIYNFKPRQGLDVRQKGEIEDITAFDPEGRDPNADGGIIGSLRLNRTGFDKGTKKPSGRGAPWKKSPFSISDDWIEKWLDKLRKKKKTESESGLNNILKL